ncbi:MAG: tRNA uridine-5-carboxymethylaminomethyl(34) synthesis enzyme MnmG [Candidatus Zixiibacteriota bacterium]
MRDFDVIVIGGGHAGIEAAAAAARMGLSTALISGELAKIGEMSCNPAIGGVGKGQLVREIDALGGLMGYITDRAGIHFRTLNKSKGPAVWSSRVQCDRRLYREFAQEELAKIEKLHLVAGMVVGIIDEDKKFCRAVLSDGREISGRACVLASGTFLNGLIHIGEDRVAAGRVNEAPSLHLSESLQELGFKPGRLKTGTPPRLEGETIDYSKMEKQPGDEDFLPLSLRTVGEVENKALCYITYTSSATHKIVEANLHRSAMFSGNIKGIGPRYCPSIEDKIHRFKDKDRHQLFIEPEGLDTTEIYINGLSTSLPADVQLDILHSIPGLESVIMKRPGYAIEYDFFPAYQIKPTLETRPVENLYFCGQINGTSGYEEAAAQGLLAGVNAAAKLLGSEQLILDRAQAYIGVMIDDLVTRVPMEPYRMFTSRAEYRLALREDNATDRLITIGRELGLVTDDMIRRHEQDHAAMALESTRLHSTSISAASVDPSANEDKLPMGVLLKRPRVNYSDFAKVDEICANFPRRLSEKLEIRIKYAGYLAKQDREIDRFRQLESRRIPDDLDIAGLTGIKKEALMALQQYRPVNLGQASRLNGITYSDITVLMVHLKRHYAGTVSRETN